MEEREDSHKLVTSGVYSVLRHPSYFGWFYWSVGTQLLLCNPLSTVAYTIASWSFFNQRIPVEEALLVTFYKEEYVHYMRRTVIGIPFIQTSFAASGAAAVPAAGTGSPSGGSGR